MPVLVSDPNQIYCVVIDFQKKKKIPPLATTIADVPLLTRTAVNQCPHLRFNGCDCVHLHRLRNTVICNGHVVNMRGAETPSIGHTPQLRGAAESDAVVFLDSSSHSVDASDFTVAMARTSYRSRLVPSRFSNAIQNLTGPLSHH